MDHQLGTTVLVAYAWWGRGWGSRWEEHGGKESGRETRVYNKLEDQHNQAEAHDAAFHQQSHLSSPGIMKFVSIICSEFKLAFT